MSTDSRTSRRASHLGPLIGSLALLTAVAGVGDAISYLGLGHVFVANMTGNTVLLGIAAVEHASGPALRTVLALAGFVAEHARNAGDTLYLLRFSAPAEPASGPAPAVRPVRVPEVVARPEAWLEELVPVLVRR